MSEKSEVGRIANPSSKEADLLDGLPIRPTGTPAPGPSPRPSGLRGPHAIIYRRPMTVPDTGFQLEGRKLAKA